MQLKCGLHLTNRYFKTYIIYIYMLNNAFVSYFTADFLDFYSSHMRLKL